jgi:hypothetical protein
MTSVAPGVALRGDHQHELETAAAFVCRGRDQLRCRAVLEPLRAKPRVVRSRPRGRVVQRRVAQGQLREPVPSPHQIAASVLARTGVQE